METEESSSPDIKTCIYKVACEVKLEDERTVDQFPIFIPFASLPVCLGEVREMLRGKGPLVCTCLQLGHFHTCFRTTT